jgi:hypothetical protein
MRRDAAGPRGLTPPDRRSTGLGPMRRWWGPGGGGVGATTRVTQREPGSGTCGATRRNQVDERAIATFRGVGRLSACVVRTQPQRVSTAGALSSSQPLSVPRPDPLSHPRLDIESSGDRRWVHNPRPTVDSRVLPSVASATEFHGCHPEGDPLDDRSRTADGGEVAEPGGARPGSDAPPAPGWSGIGPGASTVDPTARRRTIGRSDGGDQGRGAGPGTDERKVRE